MQSGQVIPMTPSMLTEREEQIFKCFLKNLSARTIKGVFCRDGVPEPDVYLHQGLRVVFVFREPNEGNKPHSYDMRAQIRDSGFRARPDDPLANPVLSTSDGIDRSA
jgi:hypothetical protein